MKITINFPELTTEEFTNAYSMVYKRPEKISNEDGEMIDNTETKEQFTEKVIIKTWGQVLNQANKMISEAKAVIPEKVDYSWTVIFE